jgi:hypothetical protein
MTARNSQSRMAVMNSLGTHGRTIGSSQVSLCLLNLSTVAREPNALTKRGRPGDEMV